MSRLFYAFIAVIIAGCAAQADMTMEQKRKALFDGTASYKLALPFEAFAMPDGATAPSSEIQGTLKLDMMALGGGFQLLRDGYKVVKPQNRIKDLPPFEFSYVQSGNRLLPVQTGIIETDHPYFEWMLSAGRTWMGDQGERYLSVPFALLEKNANCVHNGALMVRLSADGKTSNALLQIGSETCQYLQFNFWAVYPASWQTKSDLTLPPAAKAPFPFKDISALSVDYPGFQTDRLAQPEIISPFTMTAYGVVLNGNHYGAACGTRMGPYPFCDDMVIPSYSLAKSLAGGMGLMALEKNFPGVSNALITDYVPECQGKQWRGITFENALDMTTGNYKSSKPHVDEGAAYFVLFFDGKTSAEKTKFSCTEFKRRSKPGKKWVYHTSDTYLAGVAMNGYLKAHGNEKTDYYRDFLGPVWQELGLSPLSADIRRTVGNNPAPFSGYGMYLHRDDIAKIGAALADPNHKIQGYFDNNMLDSALQRTPSDRGLKAGGKDLKYQNGFWAWNAQKSLGCKDPTWLPFFSGYGGITVVMLPGGNMFYYVSDSGVHAFAGPVKALSDITPVCGENK